MRRIALFAAVVFLVGCVVPLASTQDNDPEVGWVHAFTVKAGMTKQFEDGRKRHMEWHRKQNDSWRWELWEVMTGEGTGSYYSTAFGHSWKDLDTWEAKLGDADTVDSNANMTPYLGGETSSIWMVAKEASNPGPANQMPKMIQLNHFLLKPGGDADFNDAIRKINVAIMKNNWGSHSTWFVLQDGGEGPHYVLAIDMNSWSDMAEPTLGFIPMLEKALGRHDSEALLHAADSTIKREWTETIKFRPELSYIPAGK